MDWKDYERKAMVTKSRDLDKRASVLNAILGLNGEIGEVTDLIKKNFYHGHDLDLDLLEEELGDVLWYLALLTDSLDLDFDKIQKKNLQKLEDRYDNDFSYEKSINRDKKQD